VASNIFGFHRPEIFFSTYGNNGRSNLNGEENIALTGNDATFAPLVGKMVFLLACSLSGFQHKLLVST